MKVKALITVFVALFLAGSLCSTSSHAQEEEGTIRLDDLVEEALRVNPEILASKEMVASAGARIPQVKSLPDPMFSITNRNIGSERDTEFMVGQMFPYPGKLHLKGEIAAKEMERRQEDLLGTRYSVVSRLKTAYYGLYFTYKSIEVIEKDKDLLEKFEKTAEARYAVGKGIQQDVFRAQVAISRLLDKLALLHQSKETLVAVINQLLNRPPHQPLGRPAEFQKSPLPYTLEQLSSMTLKNSPALNAAQREIEKSGHALDLAKKEYYPDFDVKGGWMNRADMEDGWLVSVGINIPIYYKSKQDYGVKEAEAELRAARQNHQAVKEALLSKVKEFYVSARTSEELVLLFKTGIIPQAELSLESAISGYEVGNVDFLTLLDNLITLLDDELEYYKEVVNFEQSLAQLEELVGSAL